MKKHEILRAWRDGEYYDSLTEEQKAMLPESPAGMDMDDDVLSSITGGCVSLKFCPTSMLCTPCPPMECAA